ncbi:MAG: hypothetical protein HRU51_02260, partial [Xanthomonadales bacterium]|nr:hypothetical protein [Xanthomonadales bacterium]
MVSTGSLTSTAVGWVREDLNRNLERLQLQIEHVANAPAATGTVLNEVLKLLNEMTGTFDTLALDSAKQISDGMHKLLQKVADGELPDRDRETVSAILAESLVVLP